MIVGQLWLIGGLLLLVAEVLVPGVFLIWLGLAALGTGLLLLLLTLTFAVQVVSFALLAAVLITVALRLRRSRRHNALNTPGSGLVGSGLRVRVGDSDWPARPAAGAVILVPGMELEVVGVDGVMLIVRPFPMPGA